MNLNAEPSSIKALGEEKMPGLSANFASVQSCFEMTTANHLI